MLVFKIGSEWPFAGCKVISISKFGVEFVDTEGKLQQWTKSQVEDHLEQCKELFGS